MKQAKYLFYLAQIFCIMFILTKIVQFTWWIVHPVKSSILLLNVTQNYDKIEQHIINFVPFGEVKVETTQTVSVINNINLYGTYASDSNSSLAFVNVDSKPYILEVGDDIQGYTVKAIKKNSIELYDAQAKQSSTVNISNNKSASDNPNLTNSNNMNNNNDNSGFNSNNIAGAVNQFVNSNNSWNDAQSNNNNSNNTNSSEPKPMGITVHKRKS
jgi:hypothetical protein